MSIAFSVILLAPESVSVPGGTLSSSLLGFMVASLLLLWTALLLALTIRSAYHLRVGRNPTNPTTPLTRYAQFEKLGTHSFLVCARVWTKGNSGPSIPVLMVLGCPTLSTVDIPGSPWADSAPIPPGLNDFEETDCWNPIVGTLCSDSRIRKTYKDFGQLGVTESPTAIFFAFPESAIPSFIFSKMSLRTAHLPGPVT